MNSCRLYSDKFNDGGNVPWMLTWAHWLVVPYATKRKVFGKNSEIAQISQTTKSLLENSQTNGSSLDEITTGFNVQVDVTQLRWVGIEIHDNENGSRTSVSTLVAFGNMKQGKGIDLANMTIPC